MSEMAVQAKQLKVGEVVEVDGRLYDVIPDKQGGVALEPAITISGAEAMAKRGTRPASPEEFEREFGDLPTDGEG